MAKLQLSVVEFLRSGRLSDSIVLFREEDDGDDREEVDASQLTMENAARVALLLVRSFVHHFQLLDECGGNDVDDLSSVQLADFYITFEQHEDCDAAGQEAGTEVQAEGRTILLMQMENFSPNKIDIPQEQQKLQQRQAHSQATSMQILGRLLYVIFSQGEVNAPPFEARTSAALVNLQGRSNGTDESDGDSSQNLICYSRSTKCSRKNATSLCSQLADTKAFPLSVCQFLSDMIDVGPKGGDGHPFASFNEIMEDLERMISRPGIFLHDSDSPPAFGHTYCGRKKEIETIMEIANRMEQSLVPTEDGESTGVEAVFLSGIAGSGKSSLAQSAGEVLSRLGWIVASAKFGRGMEHTSGGVVSAMFDQIVSHVAKAKQGGELEYSERVSKSISDAVGADALPGLAGFLPSLCELYPDLEASADDDDDALHTGRHTGWKLIHSLSKVVEAVLDSDRFIMFCFDDMQWVDGTTLQLVSEVLIKVGGFRHSCRRCLFVGAFRSDEMHDEHPLAIQQSLLRMSCDVIATEIELSSLSKDDVLDMVMSELRLPRRIASELADSVCKKTSGHALYVVELLNSLLNESIVAYSPRLHRYDWDPDRIDFIQTGTDVAELISSNLSSLPEDSQRVLRILSCFGIQTDLPLLQVLDDFQEGVMSLLEEFVEKGILDRAGPIVIFTHDLILQAVYEGMPLEERRSLHLELGRFLGRVASLGSQHIDPAGKGVGPSEQTFYAGNRWTSSLAALACDQINSAGVDRIGDEGQGMKYSKWNLMEGWRRSRAGDFSAALHLFSSGISFLPEECWRRDVQSCSALYKGAVMAAFALGNAGDVVRFADTLMEHVRFEDTFEIQQAVVRSLFADEKIEECLSRGRGILERLDINLPFLPTDEIARQEMANTESIASRYSIDEIGRLWHKVGDKSKHFAVTIIDSFYEFFYTVRSPLFQLLTCEIIKHSLQHGMRQESAIAFAIFGMLKIEKEGDFAAGKRWANLSRAIIKSYQGAKNQKVYELRALTYLHCCTDIWFTPLREIAPKLVSCTEEAIKNGRVDLIVCLVQPFDLYGGEHLSIVSQSSLQRLQLVAKHNPHVAKWLVCDYVLLMELSGINEDYFSVFGGSVYSLDDILAEAPTNLDIITHRIYEINILRSYWKGDYVAAEEYARKASLNPFFNMPMYTLALHVFFGGLVSFRMYRMLGGDARLKEGKDLLDKMQKWARTSVDVFGNNWLLMKAEYLSSIGGHAEAETLYKSSIKSSRDHGKIHELGLAYELLGNHYASIGSGEESNNSFHSAYVFYTQWGAIAVAERLRHDHNLDIASFRSMDASERHSKRILED